MINITIYNEFKHEQEIDCIKAVYPDGIHSAIADFLSENADFNVKHIATFDMPEHGLSNDVLSDTDVLIYWSHALQEDFSDEITQNVIDRISNGMGFIALHSAHFSKIMRKMLNSPMTLRWRNNDSEHIITCNSCHPIASGIPSRFAIPHEEMYGEPFGIPVPADVIFSGVFENGEFFRSGITFNHGKGRIFYFQPGHEEYPIYYTPIIQRIISNSVYWCAGMDVPSVLAADTISDNIEINLTANPISVFWDHIAEAAVQENCSTNDILDKLEGSGISAVDISLNQLLANKDEILASLRAHNLKISCIYEMYNWGYEPNEDEAKLQIDVANEVGAKNILVVPGFLADDLANALKINKSRKDIRMHMANSKEIQNMVSVLKFMTSYGKEKDVKVTLEDFDGYTACFARTEELLYFCETVDNLHITLDMGNFAYSDEDVLMAYGMLQEYITHVHCKDRGVEPDHDSFTHNKGLAAVATGSGYLPIKKIRNSLVSNGYNGYFAIEHFGAKNQLKAMLDSANFLTK